VLGLEYREPLDSPFRRRWHEEVVDHDVRIEIGRSVARLEAVGVLHKAVQTNGRPAGLPVLELVFGYPRSDGPSHAGAPVADVGAHLPTVGTTAQASDNILSVIDSSPVRGLGPYAPSAPT